MQQRIYIMLSSVLSNTVAHSFHMVNTILHENRYNNSCQNINHFCLINPRRMKIIEDIRLIRINRKA